MFNGSNCDRKSQLSGILTEPLNPRGGGHIFFTFPGGAEQSAPLGPENIPRNRIKDF